MKGVIRYCQRENNLFYGDSIHKRHVENEMITVGKEETVFKQNQRTYINKNADDKEHFDGTMRMLQVSVFMSLVPDY